MFTFRDWLSTTLAGSLIYIAWAALIAGGLLILLSISFIAGKKKNPSGFVFALVLGCTLIFVYLWLTKPFGLFSGGSFSH